MDWRQTAGKKHQEAEQRAPSKKDSWPESHTQFSKQGYVSAYDLFENDFIESMYIYTTQKNQTFQLHGFVLIV
jgi:hypothetical protein